MMAYRVLLLAALLLGTTAPSVAATVAIAWDPSSEATLTGYRVFVGTSPGRSTESIDVGRFQTSFYYTNAVPGQRYYFAVATLVPGATGPKCEEVSAVAQESDSLAAPSVPVPPSAASIGVDARLLRDSVASPQGGSGNPEAFGTVTEIASGLGDITALAVTPTGGGLLVEHGAALRTFSDHGVGESAYHAPIGTRIAALAVDPHFETTGLVYLAEARPARGGDEVSVVRHRLLAGVLGESATIVSAGVQATGTAVALAITSGGDVILAQGPRVTRFRQDGGIVRSWPMTLATGAGVTPALAWDHRRQGLWRAGVDAPADLTVSFLPLQEDASGQVIAVQPVEEGAVAVGVGVVGATATVALASDTTLFRLDLAASRLTSGTSVAGYGTVVSVVVAEPAADFVVVREPSANKAEHASYSLLRVHHRNIP